MKNKIVKIMLCMLTAGAMFSPAGAALNINPTEEVQAATISWGDVSLEGTNILEKNDYIDGVKVNKIVMAKSEIITLEDAKNVSISDTSICTAKKSGKNYKLESKMKEGSTTITITKNDGSKYKVKVTVKNNKYSLTNKPIKLYYSGSTSNEIKLKFKATTHNVKASITHDWIAKIKKVSNNEFIITATGADNLSTMLTLTANGKTYEIPITITKTKKSNISNGDYDGIWKFKNVSLGNYEDSRTNVKDEYIDLGSDWGNQAPELTIE